MEVNWIERPCRAVDRACEARALARQAMLTKPPGSLGALESAAVHLASLQGKDAPSLKNVWITVFAGDHGVAAEGVSAFPQAVTGEMVRNFARGGAAISVLARELGASLEVVNLGTVNDPGTCPGVRTVYLAPQTGNLAREAAMTDAQLAAALQAGADSVEAAHTADVQLFIAGDMGIANTTSATALACALLGELPQDVVGRGTGVDDAGLARKVAVVASALSLHADASDAREVLRRLGGFEIAAMVGAYIVAAQRGIPVLIDGFISSVAALAAVRLNPGARDWMLFSHRSHERGHALVLAALAAKPLLDLQMRLGEASGAASAVPLLRLACALHNGMATFAEAGVSDGPA